MPKERARLIYRGYVRMRRVAQPRLDPRGRFALETTLCRGDRVATRTGSPSGVAESDELIE